MDFIKGEVLLFNKPYGWTSFQLVNKIRFTIKHERKIKKIKVGHAGTLDPLATGLVILCTGQETKNIERYQNLVKEYIATFRLGATTPSFDLETEIDGNFPYDHVNEEMLKEALTKYTGEIVQEPPAFSAKFVDGVRAYKYARKGKEIKLSGQKITIQSLEVLSFSLPYFTLRIVCSKGTYIRALARDIGKSLKSGAHLTDLKRQRIGEFRVENAFNIEEFERNLVFL
ncbi:MAG: tRNA pseudouridine(55) synthase TruB [Bacteroidetes bacterium RBG_13_42_15]|nr:MAG: tRNA pseudouridine(55) synthase TruB [Bacteroidetes bacterium RBG_13_42_15]